jgi:hypothetical protein
MGKREDLLELISDIRNNMEVLSQLEEHADHVETEEIPLLGRTRSSALIVAGVVENYYTCVETILFRISQFFENNLRPDKWHQELLRKSALNIEGVRKAAISGRTRDLLDELLRFRHFKRYYFRLDYDWDRLDLLLKKVRQVRPLLRGDFTAFLAFLESL